MSTRWDDLLTQHGDKATHWILRDEASGDELRRWDEVAPSAAEVEEVAQAEAPCQVRLYAWDGRRRLGSAQTTLRTRPAVAAAEVSASRALVEMAGVLQAQCRYSVESMERLAKSAMAELVELRAELSELREATAADRGAWGDLAEGLATVVTAPEVAPQVAGALAGLVGAVARRLGSGQATAA